MRLASDRGNVLEISVVVKDDSAMVLGYGRGYQVDDTGGPVMPAGHHAHLDIPGSLSNYFGDRQHDVEALATLRDSPDVG